MSLQRRRINGTVYLEADNLVGRFSITYNNHNAVICIYKCKDIIVTARSFNSFRTRQYIMADMLHNVILRSITESLGVFVDHNQ